MHSKDLALALTRALAWSSNLMRDRLDRSGRPYMLHQLWVMNQVMHLGDDYAILAAVHDCAEDCFDTINEGVESFAENVIDDGPLIRDFRILSHDKSESYAKYIRRIVEQPRCVAVKLKDLEHNSTITRLKGLTDKDMERIKKYHASYCYLNGNGNLLLDLI